ncbi:hypothetical protein D3C73_1244180 [compost metagenome]
MIFRVPVTVTVTRTLVEPVCAVTGKVPSVEQVEVWLELGFWISQSASAEGALSSQSVAASKAAKDVHLKENLKDKPGAILSRFITDLRQCSVDL